MSNELRRSPFNAGQRLFTRVGEDLVPVRFVMPGPREVVGSVSESTTVPSKIAIVVMRGRLSVVPFDELQPTGSDVYQEAMECLSPC